MAVRAFSGANNVGIDVAPGALANHDGGPTTLLFIVKPTAVSNQGLINARESGSRKWSMNNFSDGLIYYENVGAGFCSSNTVGWNATDGWRLLGVTKANGSAVARWHGYKFSIGAASWVHVNTSSGSVGDASLSTGIDAIGLGYLDNDEVLNGRLAVAGAWKSVLTDLDIEGLTASLADWVDLSPDALWPFNQASTSDPVLDITGGGADQVAINGTSVVTGDDPPGFDFSLTADVTATDANHEAVTLGESPIVTVDIQGPVPLIPSIFVNIKPANLAVEVPIYQTAVNLR